jgi:hypothetical protein
MIRTASSLDAAVGGSLMLYTRRNAMTVCHPGEGIRGQTNAPARRKIRIFDRGAVEERASSCDD